MLVRVTFLLAAVTAAPLLLAQGTPPAKPRTQATAGAKTAPQRVLGEDGKTYELRNTPFGPMRLAVGTGDAMEPANAGNQAGAVLQTPFGPMKVAERSDPRFVQRPDATVAYEQGDSIRFERPTPFGVVRWIQKKTELNDVEKAAWERAGGPSAGQTPAGVKGAE